MEAIDKTKVADAQIQWDRFLGHEVYTVTLKNGNVYKNLAKLPNGNYKKPVLSGNIKTFKMTNDTYENIFLSRGFKSTRGYSGLKFFEHKPSETYVTYDPKGIQTRIIVESSLNSEDFYTIYQGDSISDLKKALDKQGIVILFEPDNNNNS